MWKKDPFEIIPATLADFKVLKRYHYIKDPPGPTHEIYKIIAKEPHRNDFPDPIAIILYSAPLPNLTTRTAATNNYFRNANTEIGRLRLVNQKIRYISRFIVDPRFQKNGFGTWLLKDTLERQTVPIIETTTPLDFTNKIFQKQGFKLYHQKTPKWYLRFESALTAINVRMMDLVCPPAVHYRIQRLSPKRRGYIEKEILMFTNHFRRRKGMKNSLNRTIYFCSKFPYPSAYLIWYNPREPRYDD